MFKPAVRQPKIVCACNFKASVPVILSAFRITKVKINTTSFCITQNAGYRIDNDMTSSIDEPVAK